MRSLCLVSADTTSDLDGLKADLTRYGYRTYRVRPLTALVDTLSHWRFDAVVLLEADIETIRLIRKIALYSRTPIAVLTQDLQEAERIALLEAGATATIDAPASPQFIAIKLSRLIDLRGMRDADNGDVVFGDLTLTPRSAQGRLAGNRLDLTRTEFELLLMLASHGDGFTHRDELRGVLGRSSGPGSARSVDMHISRIRQKLRAVGASALTVASVYGRGYSLDDSGRSGRHTASPTDYDAAGRLRVA